MPIDSGNLALKGLDDLFSTEDLKAFALYLSATRR